MAKKNKNKISNKTSWLYAVTAVAVLIIAVIALNNVYAHSDSRGGMNSGNSAMMGGSGTRDGMMRMMQGMHGNTIGGGEIDGMHRGMMDNFEEGDENEMQAHMQEHIEEHGFGDEEIEEHWQEMQEHCPMMS